MDYEEDESHHQKITIISYIALLYNGSDGGHCRSPGSLQSGSCVEYGSRESRKAEKVLLRTLLR